MPAWSTLEKGRDAGGVRWFLAGRPIHCGSGLLMRLPSCRVWQATAESLERMARQMEQRNLWGMYPGDLRDAMQALREPAVCVRFEMNMGEPVFYLSTGVDPFTYDESDKKAPVKGTHPEAFFGGRSVRLEHNGDGWSQYLFRWVTRGD